MNLIISIRHLKEDIRISEAFTAAVFSELRFCDVDVEYLHFPVIDPEQYVKYLEMFMEVTASNKCLLLDVKPEYEAIYRNMFHKYVQSGSNVKWLNVLIASENMNEFDRSTISLECSQAYPLADKYMVARVDDIEIMALVETIKLKIIENLMNK